MSKANEIWVCTKNGKLVGCVTSKTKAIGEMRELAQAPEAEPVEKKDGSLMLKGVLRFRAKPMTVK
jgi:N-acetylglutamate synthase-like GNAT family acetyltransferase